MEISTSAHHGTLTMEYGFSRTISLPFDQALEKIQSELQKEGFGVLTSIDVKETLKKKLQVDFQRYTILGACNPHFAHKALLAEEQLGLLLPCNVIVYEKNGKTVVAAFDPHIMEAIIGNPVMRGIADEVAVRLRRAVDAV